MYDLLRPFTFAALYIFIPSVPVTHGLGLAAHCPKAAKTRHLLLYPFKGGQRHTIFQVIAWLIWALAVLVALPVVSPALLPTIPPGHVELLSGAAAIGGVFAELFMIKSLLVFEPRLAKTVSGEVPYRINGLPSRQTTSAAVVGMGLLWTVMGGALLLATEYLEQQTSRLLYFGLAAACLLIGATTTHGLAGALKHAGGTPRAGAKPRGPWRFWQPFKGGKAFVATQALGWVFFSCALLALAWLVGQAAAGVAYCVRCWALATGTAMFLAQLMLGASVWTYKSADVTAIASAVASAVAHPRRTISRSTVWLPIIMLYTPVHLFCAAVVLSFSVLPPAYAAAAWVGGLCLYSALTFPGEPEHTGKREWPAVERWVTRTMEVALEAWFGGVSVVREGKEELDPAGRYVFGYVPHGLFPIGAGYLPHLPSFKALFPKLRPVTLVASVIHFTPVIRDLCQWCGLRQVTRRTFAAALQDRGAVVLVPGGQAELVHTWRIFQRVRQWVVYTRHKGFVRIALQQQAALVPVVVLGELDSLRNLINLPLLQQWTYKKIGFPVPYLVVGRWGLSPFPRYTGALKFVIGEPIKPPPLPADLTLEGEQALVDALHKQFYAAVADLFRRHKDSVPAYRDVELVLID